MEQRTGSRELQCKVESVEQGAENMLSGSYPMPQVIWSLLQLCISYALRFLRKGAADTPS